MLYYGYTYVFIGKKFSEIKKAPDNLYILCSLFKFIIKVVSVRLVYKKLKFFKELFVSIFTPVYYYDDWFRFLVLKEVESFSSLESFVMMRTTNRMHA